MQSIGRSKKGDTLKKIFCFVVLLMFALPIIAQAATVTLAWDPMPAGQAWTKVQAYERTGTITPYTYVKVGETPSVVPPAAPVNTLAFQAAIGTHTYIVRSTNGQSESGDSNAVQGIILATPSSPTTITITITVP
jgi:hypothetical protein